MPANHKGTANRENRIRESIRQKVISSAVEGKNIPSTGIIPGLHERWDRPKNEQIAFLVPANHIKRVAEKIIRGIYFIEDKNFINSNYTVDFFVLSSEVGNELLNGLFILY